MNNNLLEIAQKALKHHQSDQAEVLIISNHSGLTRFANSQIHQNVVERNLDILFRSVIMTKEGAKIGSAQGNSTAEEDLKKLARRSAEIARLQLPNPHFKGLPGPEPVSSLPLFEAETAACGPQERAEKVKTVVELCKPHEVTASGAFSTAVVEVAVANSLGVAAHYATTEASLNMLLMKDLGSGYAQEVSRRVNTLDFAALTKGALKKCLDSQKPQYLPPGSYTVVLEEHAVANLVGLLAYMGFGALSFQEGRSFMSGKIGQKILGENVTLWDDGLNLEGMAMPIDYEGVPKRRVDIIHRGVAKGVVYDSYFAGKEGKKTTGHALPAPNTYGPFPLNLFMAPGDSSREEMFRSISRGVLVSRFHYTNVLDPMTATATGLTRDGAFLIEEGKIKNPIDNLRFTESLVRAFNNISAISKKTKIAEGFLGPKMVPALKIENFTFSGGKEG